MMLYVSGTEVEQVQRAAAALSEDPSQPASSYSGPRVAAANYAVLLHSS